MQYKKVENLIKLFGISALAVVFIIAIMSGFLGKLFSNFTSLFVFFFLFAIIYVILKYVFIGNVCYEIVYLLLQNKEDPETLLQLFKQSNIKLFYEKVIETKKDYGYLYLVRVNKDDLNNLVNLLELKK